MKHNYRPSNIVVSVAGNIEHDMVVGKMAALLGDWATGEAASYRAAEDNQNELRLRIHYKETEQAHLCLSVPGIPRDHPDRFKLRLLNTVLGEGMSSRLFTEIRERLGLAYSIYSYTSGMHDTGAAGVYAGVDPRRIEDAIKAVLTEWDKLRQESVPADELAKAKEFVKLLVAGGLDISVQSYKAACPPGALTKLPLIAGREVVDLVVSRMACALRRL